MPFNPLQHPIALISPRFLSDRSAWVGHIPFAMTLVDLLRPKSIVELGTHQGDSYCAFCQAVATLNLPTKCAAVDTWQGDAQTGPYGGEVLANLREAHDLVYAGFSRLIQSTFDNAAAQFPNGSIDLLHIDGLHTYDAVRHDFETWLPKMSPGGVVLLHDAVVNTNNFGVGRLWREISPGRPHFLFEHSYGLGVLVVGDGIPQAFSEFLFDAAKDPLPVRTYFARLGEAVELTRYLKIMISFQIRMQEVVNQWKRRTGRPVDRNSTDIRTAFSDTLGYTSRVCGEIESALNDTATFFNVERAEELASIAPAPRRISIIICSIDKAKFAAVSEMYSRLLGAASFEIVGIHDARSMAEGYNRGIDRSNGEVLIFSHDDVEFITPEFTSRLLVHLEAYDVVGLAGTTRLCGNTWLAAGPPFLFGQVSHPAEDGGFNVNIFGAPQPVVGDMEALDGLFLAANRAVVQKVRFDEAFDGFHFYDLDFSAAAHKAGFKLAVANDLHVIHGSAGKMGPAWERPAENSKRNGRGNSLYELRARRCGHR